LRCFHRFFFFFFQAEDGIRDFHVTGVQTCALPILPKLESRWPSYRHNWHRSATLARDADALLTQLADLDLAAIPHSPQPGAATLDCHALAAFDPARQRNILRRWLQLSDALEPGYHLLQQLVREVIPAGPDAQPQVSWSAEAGAFTLRRHRGQLILSTSVPFEPSADAEFELTPQQPLSLPGNGSVMLNISDDPPRSVARFSVRYRCGGEELRLQGRRTRSLKKILQE